MSRSTKVGMILAAFGQSVLYSFAVMGFLRFILFLFGTKLPRPISGSMFLTCVAVISAVSVTMCVQQINRSKSLPIEKPVSE